MRPVTPHDEHFKLLSLSQRSETGERPHARVVISIGNAEVSAESDGNGPVDASLKAIESQVKSGCELLLYSVNAITTGTESQGEVTVRLARAGRHRQRHRRRPRHRRRFGQGVPERAEQAAQRG